MYQFNLEILRKYRKRQEEKIQKIFSDRKVKLLSEEKKLKDLIQKKSIICNQKKKNIINDEFKSNEKIMFYQYIRNLDELIENQNIKVKETKKNYLEIYEDLKNAVKKRKMIESLKEKGLQGYLIEEKKKEQNQLDEMGIMSFQRKK